MGSCCLQVTLTPSEHVALSAETVSDPWTFSSLQQLVDLVEHDGYPTERDGNGGVRLLMVGTSVQVKYSNQYALELH